MLARVLAMARCLSVSVTSRCSIKTVGQIELVFGNFLRLIHQWVVTKFRYLNKGTSIWNFVLNSGLRKFRHGISIVETCYQLSSTKVDAQRVINWTVFGHLS